ncbi:MAG: very short patch repair endonuclease [Pirellulales bacterium]
MTSSAKRHPSNEQTGFGSLTRSELMRRVRSTGNATTERRMVALLRAERLSGWRRHAKLPGRPDFIWRARKVALFVDGCFWHGHDCPRNLSPRTNVTFWKTKIEGNRERDRAMTLLLRRRGWTVIRIWECQLKARPSACVARLRTALSSVLSKSENS